MTPLRQTNFRIDESMLEALSLIKERDGIPVTEQVRRALLAWFELKGVELKTDRKRASTRKRP